MITKQELYSIKEGRRSLFSLDYGHLTDKVQHNIDKLQGKINIVRKACAKPM